MAKRTAPGPANYLLRDIDRAEWTRARARAAKDGLTLRTVLLLLIKGYADGRLAVGGYTRDDAPPPTE